MSELVDAGGCREPSDCDVAAGGFASELYVFVPFFPLALLTVSACKMDSC